jgi:tetratricopeptide (TPR) repeat protein
MASHGPLPSAERQSTMRMQLKKAWVYLRLLWNYVGFWAYPPENCYSRIGAIYFEYGNYRKAISLFLKSEDSHGRRDVGLTKYNSYYLGYSYWNLGALKEANGHLEDYFRLNRKDWQIASMVAWYYGVIRKNETALDWYLQAMALEPRLLGPRIECSRLLSELGRIEEAVGQIDEAMRLTELSIERRIIESVKMKISGDPDGAVQTLKKAISEPDSVWASANLVQKEDAHMLLAKFQRDLGDTKGALVTLESAAQRRADDPWVIDELVMEYADQGVRLEEALALIERALKHQPENPIFLDTKGWVLFKLGRSDEAKALIERCRELLPEYEEAKEHFHLVSSHAA